MKTTSLPLSAPTLGTQPFGLTHLAIEVGAHLVDELAKRFTDDEVLILDGPRRTGDGYYEAAILDPDGNRVEICAEKADT
jgi:lactoylglutathione lyase